MLTDTIYITLDARMLDFFDHENRFIYHMESIVADQLFDTAVVLELQT